MEYLPYSDSLQEGVIQCLRGYPELAPMTDEELFDWLKPIVSYSWEDDIDENLFPYKYGVVLVDEGRVVGFCGLIYSYQYFSGEKKVCINTSTWIIEPEYRFGTFTVLKMIMETADVVTDFTPSEKMAKINERMFRFRFIDTQSYKLYPTESVDSASNEKICFDSNCDKLFPNFKVYVKDHLKYGCKTLVYETVDEKTLTVCYYVSKDKKYKENCRKWAQVIAVSDKDIFAESVQTIVDAIYQHDGVAVLCDARFVGNIDYYENKELVSRRRMQYSADELENDAGMFYSEMILLGH